MISASRRRPGRRRPGHAPAWAIGARPVALVGHGGRPGAAEAAAGEVVTGPCAGDLRRRRAGWQARCGQVRIGGSPRSSVPADSRAGASRSHACANWRSRCRSHRRSRRCARWSRSAPGLALPKAITVPEQAAEGRRRADASAAPRGGAQQRRAHGDGAEGAAEARRRADRLAPRRADLQAGSIRSRNRACRCASLQAGSAAGHSCSRAAGDEKLGSLVALAAQRWPSDAVRLRRRSDGGDVRGRRGEVADGGDAARRGSSRRRSSR